MSMDVSLIPQNRVENLLSKLSEIENNIGNIGTDITNNIVHKTGNETITGRKTFYDFVTIVGDTTEGSKEGGEINFGSGAGEPNTGKMMHIDRYNGTFRMFGSNSSGVINVPLTVDIEHNVVLGATPPVGDTGNKLATTGWINDPTKSTNVLHRTGDETFSGNKSHVSNTADIAFTLKDTEADNRKDITAPSASRLRSFRMMDKNNRIIGDIRSGINTSGTTTTQVVCRKYNEDGSSNTNATLDLAVDNNLNTYFNFPKCTTKATTSSTAANNKVAVIVQNYKSGTNWYRVWSDGWIEQGGYTPRTADAFISVSFAKAFSQDNPNVQLTRRFYYDNDSTACQNRTTGVSSVTTTGFKCYDNGWSSSGGSAGVWYACGY